MHGTADALRWNGAGIAGRRRAWERDSAAQSRGCMPASTCVDGRRARRPARFARFSGTTGEHALFALALAALGGLHVAAVALFL